MARSVIKDEPPALTLKIDADNENSRLQLTFASDQSDYGPYLHPNRDLTPASYKTSVVNLREKLTDWSKKYDSFLVNPTDEIECSPERSAEVWKGMAEWGRETYRQLFDLDGGNSDDLINRSNELSTFAGSRIVIDSSAINSLPWGLLYDGELPENFEGDYVARMLPHFWVTKYKLEILPNYPTNKILWKTLLENKTDTRMTVTINQGIKGNYGVRQDTFFNELAPRLKASQDKVPPSTLVVNYDKTALIQSISQRAEPQHLIYFFCHHKKAGGEWTPRGYLNFDETKLIIQGEDAEVKTATLTVKEMKHVLKSFDSPPVVFFNACESVQSGAGDPSSFMSYFIFNLKAWAFIGTEAEIPAKFADEFGKHFVDQFLDAVPVGEILYKSRREFARDYNNPFALYYALYGNGNVRLKKRVRKS